MSPTAVAERPTEAPKVDPRMRDRWVRARRQEGRRRLRVLGGLGALALLGAAAFGVAQSPLLRVHTVRVNGAVHETVAQVAAVGGLTSHPTMLGLDPSKVARRIDSLPWVASAHVARRWPRTVTVTVAERSAIAVVPLAPAVSAPAAIAAVTAGAPTVLVDSTGRVLGPATGVVPGLPLIVTDHAPGAAGTWLAGTTTDATSPSSRTPLDAVLQLATEIPPSLSASVTSLGVGPHQTLVGEVGTPASSSDTSPSFTVKNTGPGRVEVPVNFGDSTALPTKIMALQTLMAQVDLSHVTAIDVSDSQYSYSYLTGNPQPGSLSTTAGG